MVARNPILPGFNPDPSFCRVGEDYYIATSTFEWYPGVQIHHSRDLVNWTLVSRPLERADQLDMRGNPDSGGIWAPCLSYADGQFWLIYTDIKRLDGNYKDAHNYLVTCPTIDGEWSSRTYMNSSGFDPSLFHDDDGRKWFVNMVWDHRGYMEERDPPRGMFNGILLQEYDHEAGALIGPIKRIFDGSPHGMTEAPHLFKRDGYYYLVTAEGGTGYEHAVTHARSKSIDGPYELHPDWHPLTARKSPEAFVQRVGHGQSVETPEGRTFHTFLMGRPLPDVQRCPMGRETGLREMEWREDGWMYVKGDGADLHRIFADDADAPAVLEPVEVRHYRFDDARLPMDFQWPRSPEKDRLFSPTALDEGLRLFGRESMGSWFEQALVARRQTAWDYSVEVTLDFAPEGYQQMAGLATYYNRFKFHYLAVTLNDAGERVLVIQSCPGDYPEGAVTFPLDEGIALPDGPIRLGVDTRGRSQQFRWAPLDGPWQDAGPALDASVLSDEGGRGEHASFTGNFVGMAANDLTGRAKPADFFDFRYANQPVL